MKLARRFWLGLALALALAPQACTSPPAPVRQPALELAPAKLDLGTLTQNQPARASVQLRNLGPFVRPSLAASSARCRAQGLPESLATGQTATLTVICQSDLLGPLQEQLLLLDGDVLATLGIVGKVEPLVGFDTTFLDLRPAFGQTQSADVRLVGARAAQARPKVTTTGGDLVTVTPLPSNAGAVPGFRVACRGHKVGMHAGSLVVATGLPESPTLTLSWGCRVPATLQVEPSHPYFNLRVSGARATTLTVSSTHPGFTVKSAKVSEGPFTATVEKPHPDGRVPITIRVKNHEIPDDARSATGKLLIQTNDPREPNKEVPLFGLGRINKVTRPE